MPHLSSGAEGLPPMPPPRSSSRGAPQLPGKPRLCWNQPGKGMGVPAQNKDAVHRPGAWEVVMGGREGFQGWGSGKTGRKGLMQNVDAQGDTLGERLRSVTVIRTGIRGGR